MRHSQIFASFFLFSLVICFYTGCSTDSGSIDFHLNLDPPEIQGRQVTVNGGVLAPVERIQWEWGDGQIDRHHFFPATHTYNNPGRYEIKVTVFSSNNRSASKSVIVDIK